MPSKGPVELSAVTPVKHISVVAFFALVKLRRVVILNGARLGQGDVVSLVGWPCQERKAAALARKGPWL
ncbi:MAG: hypothetical protein ACREBU_17240 [Nitrososphaera sp.]